MDVKLAQAAADAKSPLGYKTGAVSELIEHYLDNPHVYGCEPYFFAWADKALIVHRKKK